MYSIYVVRTLSHNSQCFMCMNRMRYTIILFNAHVNPSNTFEKTNAEQSGVLSASDLRCFHADTMAALLLGSSAAHQRLRWLRFDLDKCVCERGGVNLCAWSPWGAPFSSWTHSSSVPSQFIDLLPAQETCLLFYFHTDTWKVDEGWCVGQKKPSIPFPSISFLSMLEHVTWKLADSSKHILFSLASLCSITLHYFLYPLLSLPL